MIKSDNYCTQNRGHCESCSLVSYNRDCRNEPLPVVPYPDHMGEWAGRRVSQARIVCEIFGGGFIPKREERS